MTFLALLGSVGWFNAEKEMLQALWIYATSNKQQSHFIENPK